MKYFRPAVVWLAGAAVALGMSSSAMAATDLGPELNAPFPYMAIELPLEQVLSDFSVRTGTAIRTYDVLDRQVTISNSDGTIQDFLNQLSDQGKVSWWFDGAALHFELNETASTHALASKGWSAEELDWELTNLGLRTENFPLSQSSDQTIVYVKGPEHYVKAVSELSRTLIDTRQASIDTGPRLPNIIFGMSGRP